MKNPKSRRTSFRFLLSDVSRGDEYCWLSEFICEEDLVTLSIDQLSNTMMRRGRVWDFNAAVHHALPTFQLGRQRGSRVAARAGSDFASLLHLVSKWTSSRISNRI
jgi:hypothetical protein